MALTTTKQRRAIGERLAQERRRLNYTELQIAQLLGVQLEVYLQYESGEDDPGIFSMQRLYSIGFDVMFIITGDRYRPVQEESELLNRFRELSLRGKTSVFMTLDALERLAPNLKENIKKKIRDTNNKITEINKQISEIDALPIFAKKNRRSTGKNSRRPAVSAFVRLRSIPIRRLLHFILVLRLRLRRRFIETLLFLFL